MMSHNYIPKDVFCRYSRLEKHKMPAVRLVQTDSAQYQYQNTQSRARLDSRMWLTTKAALVESLLGEIKGMGLVKGWLLYKGCLYTFISAHKFFPVKLYNICVFLDQVRNVK